MRRLLLAALLAVSTYSAQAQVGSAPLGPMVFPVNPVVNGLSLPFALRQDAAGTGSGGSAYAAGDVVTLSGGVCSTAPTLVLWTSGAAPKFSVQNPGSCTVPPSDPVSVTGGSGTGATFTLGSFWGLIAANVPAAPFVPSGVNGTVFYPPSLAIGVINPNLGPNCFGNPGSCGGGANNADGQGGGTGMTGAENTFFGFNTGPQVTTGNFLTFIGHHAGGHEVTGANEVLVGTDAGKWVTGGSAIVGNGTNALKFQLNPLGVVAVGTSAAIGGQFISAVSAAVTNAGACQVTVASTTGMLTGDTAVVTGVQGATGCNGVFTNVTVAGNNITLTGSTFGGSYTTGGSVSDYGSVALGSTVAIGNGALGSSALRSAGPLVVVGAGAANALTTSIHDIVIGNNAGTGLTSGSNNTIVGDAAGQAITTTAQNVVVGGGANPTGAVNNTVIVGQQARSGGNSVVIGQTSGNASLTGLTNTIIGFSIAHTTCTTAANDIFIGVNNNVDCGTNSDAHAIVIGTQASLTSGGSNTINVEGIWKATGTGTPSTASTTINGTLTVANIASTAQADVVCTTSAGLLTFQVSATGCASSSERFKQDLHRISDDEGLRVVAALEPKDYRYRPETDMGDDIHFGFTAEQVEKIDPHLITYEADGVTPHAVKYNELWAFFAAAIRKQQAEIEALREKVHHQSRHRRRS